MQTYFCPSIVVLALPSLSLNLKGLEFLVKISRKSMSVTTIFSKYLAFFITIVKKGCIILPVIDRNQLRGNWSKDWPARQWQTWASACSAHQALTRHVWLWDIYHLIRSHTTNKLSSKIQNRPNTNRFSNHFTFLLKKTYKYLQMANIFSHFSV